MNGVTAKRINAFVRNEQREKTGQSRKNGGRKIQNVEEKEVVKEDSFWIRGRWGK